MNRMIQWQYSILAFMPLFVYYLFAISGEFELLMPTVFIVLLLGSLLLICNLDWKIKSERSAWLISVFISTFPYLLLISKITDNFNHLSFFYIHFIWIGGLLYPIRKSVFFVPAVIISTFGPLVFWGSMEAIKDTNLSRNIMDHFLVQSYGALAISIPIMIFTGLFLTFLIIINELAERKFL